MMRIAAASVLLIGFCLPPSFAQTVVDPTRDYLRDAERKRTMQRLEESQAGQAISPVSTSEPVRDEACLPVRGIAITGVTILTPADIAQVTSRYADHCLGQSSIEALLKELNGIYAERGFITTRAYVPEQDLKSGTLRVEVVEGRIEAVEHFIIRGDGTETVASSTKTASALPARAGGALNLRDLEQGLDNINRLASSRSSLDIAPGASVGGSVVRIREEKRARFRVSAGADNAGSEATGRYRGRLVLEGDDLLYLNDAWNVSYITSRNTNSIAGFASLPFGYNELSVNGAYSENQQLLTETSLLFGQTTNLGAKVERLIWRDATTKLRVSAGLKHYWNGRLINTAQLLPSEQMAARIAASAEIHASGSVSQVEVGLTRGVSGLAGIDNLPGDPSITPNLDFTKIDAAVYWIKAFAWGRLVTNLQGQASANALLSPEQLSIGGWDSVRGYLGSEASGDHGLLARTELIFPLPSKAGSAGQQPGFWATSGLKVEPFAFCDGGRVWSYSGSHNQTMIGAGAGLRIGTDRFRLELAAAAPLIKEPGVTADWQIFGSINVKIF